jgi:hypothetical protein
MLYRVTKTYSARPTTMRYESDHVSGAVLDITQNSSDILAIARVGDKPVISICRKYIYRNTPPCIWCGAPGKLDCNFLNATNVSKLSHREMSSCAECAMFAAPILFGDMIYNIYHHSICIVGETYKTFIRFPSGDNIRPIISCPEARNLYVLAKYELHSISDRSIAVTMPYPSTNRFGSPFMRDNNTLCAWIGHDRFLIWDTRTDNAPVHTVDGDAPMARESSAFSTDNLFLSLSSTYSGALACGTYDLRNVSSAIFTTPTRANAVV